MVYYRPRFLVCCTDPYEEMFWWITSCIIRLCSPMGTVHGVHERSKCQQFRNVLNNYPGSKHDIAHLMHSGKVNSSWNPWTIKTVIAQISTIHTIHEVPAPWKQFIKFMNCLALKTIHTIHEVSAPWKQFIKFMNYSALKTIHEIHELCGPENNA